MLTDISLPYELVDILQLQDWIKNYNSRLGTIIEGCGYEEITRQLTVVSTEQLSNQDLEDISAAVSSYTNPAIPPSYKIINTGLQKVDVDSSDFRTILQYEYKINEMGRNLQVHIRSIPILNANTSDMTYTIRVVNVNHNMVLGSITSTNSEYTENLIVLDDILHCASSLTLEIQVKTNSPGTISILSAHIQYI